MASFRDITNRTATPTSNMMRSMAELSISKTPSSARRGNGSGLLGNPVKTPNNTSMHGTSQSFCGNRANSKVQGKGLRRREVTPSRSQNFSATANFGDRFIPNRNQSQFELGNYKLSRQNGEGEDVLNTSRSAPSSPRKDPKAEAMMKMMRVKSSNDVSEEDDRIFVYRKNMAPAPPIGFGNQPKVLYSACQPSSSVKKSARHIPAAPDKILDAPDFQDDYYTNLVDWSALGIVAVALHHMLYLWNSSTGEIQMLFEMDENDPMQLIQSVRWSGDGRFLAVGFADGSIRIYDPTRAERPELRKMTIPWVSRVGCIAWRGQVLSAGHRSGQIIHHDVRQREHHIGTWNNHTFEVCGLEWKSDGKICASGGGDNVVNIWSEASINCDPQGETGPDPLYHLTDHVSTVKAIAFCPYKSACLATGGGQQDRSVKLWDLNTGKLDKSIDTDSQVTGIRFNETYKEMVTAHGTPSNVLKIWKHPTYSDVATLSGHTGRVLGLTMSPCGEYVLSASADESLRIWHCFKVDASTSKAHRSKTANFGMSMR